MPPSQTLQRTKRCCPQCKPVLRQKNKEMAPAHTSNQRRQTYHSIRDGVACLQQSPPVWSLLTLPMNNDISKPEQLSFFFYEPPALKVKGTIYYDQSKKGRDEIQDKTPQRLSCRGDLQRRQIPQAFDRSGRLQKVSRRDGLKVRQTPSLRNFGSSCISVGKRTENLPPHGTVKRHHGAVR